VILEILNLIVSVGLQADNCLYTIFSVNPCFLYVVEILYFVISEMTFNHYVRPLSLECVGWRVYGMLLVIKHISIGSLPLNGRQSRHTRTAPMRGRWKRRSGKRLSL